MARGAKAEAFEASAKSATAATANAPATLATVGHLEMGSSAGNDRRRGAVEGEREEDAGTRGWLFFSTEELGMPSVRGDGREASAHLAR